MQKTGFFFKFQLFNFVFNTIITMLNFEKIYIWIYRPKTCKKSVKNKPELKILELKRFQRRIL